MMVVLTSGVEFWFVECIVVEGTSASCFVVWTREKRQGGQFLVGTFYNWDMRREKVRPTNTQ